MISELKIEGGYKKPELHDLFAMRLILFPYNFFVWCKTYYRRYYSNQVIEAFKTGNICAYLRIDCSAPQYGGQN